VKYVVDVNGRSVVVEVDGDRARVDGTEVRVGLAHLAGAPMALVTLDEAVHRVAVARGARRGQYSLSVDGRRFEVEALDERSHAIRELSVAAAAPTGPAPLVAPMPGLIVRVNVTPGETVQAGQGLVVMEAMKMENELRAAAPGVVTAVRVSPGTAVERGATLVELG
jgi:biotin carboxyl carrier protein